MVIVLLVSIIFYHFVFFVVVQGTKALGLSNLEYLYLCFLRLSKERATNKVGFITMTIYYFRTIDLYQYSCSYIYLIILYSSCLGNNYSRSYPSYDYRLYMKQEVDKQEMREDLARGNLILLTIYLLSALGAYDLLRLLL